MTLLNQASKIALGNQQADAVYVGTTKVWPPNFSPNQISGCCIWMDASQLGYADTQTVTTWPNLGSGGQPTRTGTPQFRVGALNGLPVVKITQGAGKFRYYGGTGVDKEWTLIYVGRRWSIRPGRVIAAWGTTANLLVGFHGTEMDQAYIEGWLTSGVAPTSSTQWKLYSADSSSWNFARFFVNGVLNSTGTGVPAKGWGGTFCISGYSDDAAVATSQEADCEIAEIVLYNRRLSDAERQQVESYLRVKWRPTSLFKPTDLITNLTAWFDGADPSSVQIAGSGVSNWINKGTSGMSLTQSNDAYRPSYANNSVNFVQGKVLNGTAAPANYDFLLVAQPNSWTDWRTMLRSATNHEIIIESTSYRFGVFHNVSGFLPAGGLQWPPFGDTIGFCRVTPSVAVLMSLNGGTVTSTGTALSAGSVATTMFGGYAGPPPSQAFGNVKEAIYVPYNLDSARQLLEGYLAWKWGLVGALPAGHPYKNVAP
jgi:hypothetical protein